jgi:hypothetical protein
MELQIGTFSGIQLLTQMSVYYKQKLYKYLQNVILLIVNWCFLCIVNADVDNREKSCAPY